MFLWLHVQPFSAFTSQGASLIIINRRRSLLLLAFCSGSGKTCICIRYHVNR